MKQETRRWILLGIAALLLAPALLINLGMMPFIDDEAIRALVALEMDYSGDYLVPKLNGDLYFNKPPLYNWILLQYFWLLDGYNEFNSRLATVVSLLFYGGTVFYYFRKYVGNQWAVLNALVLITCGRILLWDSQLGLIDITFSWLIFWSFLQLYTGLKNDRPWAAFGITYTLAAMAFLMKGLPAVVFQGTSVLLVLSLRREWLRLFSIPHIVSGLWFLTIVGGYYYAYSQHGPLDELLGTLLNESSKRTAVNYGWWASVQHVFTFPVEMMYHFLPWSLMIILLIHRQSRQIVRENPFLQFLGISFLVHILLYWTSVEVYPRYLLMHAPLFFGFFLGIYQGLDRDRPWIVKVYEGMLFLLILLFLGACTWIFFWERAQFVSNYFVKGVALSLSMFSIVVLFVFWYRDRLFIIVIALLILRIGFNWFVIPDRQMNDWGASVKRTTIEMGRLLHGTKECYIYKATGFQPTNSFYFTRQQGRVIPRKYEGFKIGDYIIVDRKVYSGVLIDRVGEIRLRYDRRSIEVGRFMGYKDRRMHRQFEE